MKLHLVIPMGGAGLRFSQEIGFNIPKPLIPIRSKPFFYWSAISVLKRMPVDNLTFIVLQDHIDNFCIDKEIKSYFPNAQIAVLEKQLAGPVMTCMSGLEQIVCNDDEMLLITDCDHTFRCDKLANDIEAAKEGFNALVTFKSQEPCYSYIRYDEQGKFIGTVEKKVASKDAICGAYMYKNFQTFKSAACKLIRRGMGDYNEFFMSDTYNIMAGNQDIKVYSLDIHTSFGTPAEYHEIIKPEHDFEFTF